MTDVIAHRGPDADGVWCAPDGGPVLAHRRLSIVDLSPCGAQPMCSESGRYVLAYNGEVYNFRALRRELAAAGARFRGHSDTEVLLAACERWGVAGAIGRCAGMFAFALWDAHERALHLGRDRFGEKPLYYGLSRGTMLFGSELKALRAHPDWSGRIDRGALALYVRHSYVPGPYSVYEGVAKVEPGTIVTIRGGPQATPEVERYWSALDVAERGLARPRPGTPGEVVDALDTLLREVVGEQMLADVPLGAFLSGGIDSSLVVALMQVLGSRPARTFTIGFHEQGFDEAAHARAVAAHLGTEHTELYVTSDDALDVIPRLPALYDEPFADSSQIPTFLVAQLARRHVTVALSGDGGDEQFAGYNRYTWGVRMWGVLGRVPGPVRAAAARGIRAVRPPAWDRLIRATGRLGRYAGAAPGDRMHKLAGIMDVDGPEALYRELVTTWPDPVGVVVGGREHASALTGRRGDLAAHGMVSRMQHLDQISYLPDDILVKVDRAAMGVSLETRAPLLDHRVTEFAWSVPLALKVRDGQGKWLLRQLLYRYVPRELVERPKVGFALPLADWLRGPLRAWASDLLSVDRLRREGMFDADVVAGRWAEHLDGSRNWQSALWNVLMFQAWRDAQ